MRKPLELFDLARQSDSYEAPHEVHEARRHLRLRLVSAAAGFVAAYLEVVAAVGDVLAGNVKDTVLNAVAATVLGAAGTVMYGNAAVAAAALPAVVPEQRPPAQ